MVIGLGFAALLMGVPGTQETSITMPGAPSGFQVKPGMQFTSKVQTPEIISKAKFSPIVSMYNGGEVISEAQMPPVTSRYNLDISSQAKYPKINSGYDPTLDSAD